MKVSVHRDAGTANAAAADLLAAWLTARTEGEARNAQFGSHFNPLALVPLKETVHSRIIGELLNPCGSHGQRSLFLRCLLVRLGVLEPDSGEWRHTVEADRVDVMLARAQPRSVILIENKANEFLAAGLKGVLRLPFERALAAPTTRRHDFLSAYVGALGSVIDMDAIRAGGIRMGADPMGGAGVHYWRRIAEQYRLDLTVVSEEIDPAFQFMSLDWDGRIRMDPSSAYAMQRLIAQKDRFDIAFGCDTDHDRHGIVTRGAGLLPSNHYLSVAIDYLFQNRPGWPASAAVGKTIVSTGMIDRVAARLGRTLYEVPVGFKWFVDGLASGALGFGGEESAGATFLRCDGGVWTTEKDGIIPCLLAAEMTARTGRDPGDAYRALEANFGVLVNDRVDAAATPEQKALLAKIEPDRIRSTTLAGEKIVARLSTAPANGASIGGIKVITPGGWFAARPSGTENIYKIYAESSRGQDHLRLILDEAQAVVDAAIAAPPAPR